MSLASSKLARFTLGIAASGGVALFLAGSASAATTTSGNVKLDASAPTATVVDNSSTTVSQTTTNTTVGTTPSGGNDSTNPPTPGETATPTGIDANVSQTVGTAATTPADSPATPAPGATIDVAAATVASLAAGQPTAPAAEATVKADIAYDYPTYYRTSTINPTDTPVALTSARAERNEPAVPQPAPKTSGVLTALTTQLAGTIVPGLIRGFDAGLTGGFASLQLAIILILISLVLPVLTYTTLLRLAGYATAARSDVGRALFFATPQLLDYVKATSPPIVLFGGVRNQKNGFMTY